tara:strand:+ start:346 stop:621 length:276 start_codon:yes stop_codon:yes gene_type:complete
MAQCDECGCFDDNHIDNMAGIEDLTQDHKDWTNRYFYWHGDIQEDYQMPTGYDCLCEECFRDFSYEGKIIDTDSPDWDTTKHGWFIPNKEN